MKTNNDNRIIQLLDKFFDGRTSPIEEAELEQLINTTDLLPAGRENDCDAFMLCRESCAVEVPAGLRERLEKTIDNCAKEELETKARLAVGSRRRLAWASAAAAAVVALALIMPILRPGQKSSLPDDAPMARLDSFSPRTDVPAEATFIPSPTEADSAKVETPATTTANAPVTETRETMAQPNPKAAATTSPTRIVDDPAEAAMYLAKALGRLERAKCLTTNNIAKCDRLLERAGLIIGKVSGDLTTTPDTHAKPSA